MYESNYFPIEKQHELAACLYIALARSRGDVSSCEKIFDTHPILEYEFIRGKIGLRWPISKEEGVPVLIYAAIKDTPSCIKLAEQHASYCIEEGGKIDISDFTELEKNILLSLYQIRNNTRQSIYRHC